MESPCTNCNKKTAKCENPYTTCEKWRDWFSVQWWNIRESAKALKR